MNNNPFKTPMMANISGLKCDNPECEYKDDTVDSVDYEQHIDKPCPDCGESLLTQDDYDKVQQIQQQIQQQIPNSIYAVVGKHIIIELHCIIIKRNVLM